MDLIRYQVSILWLLIGAVAKITGTIFRFNNVIFDRILYAMPGDYIDLGQKKKNIMPKNFDFTIS